MERIEEAKIAGYNDGAARWMVSNGRGRFVGRVAKGAPLAWTGNVLFAGVWGTRETAHAVAREFGGHVIVA